MKKRRNPNLIIAVFMLVAVGMIIGYAYLSKTLNINGTIGVTKNTWNVKFRNIQVENGSVEAAAPSLSNSDTTITITPTLDTFGDYYEFTVEVYNEGSIDAMLQAVPDNPLSTEQQKLLEWTLTYDDGIALTTNDKIKTKESDTLRVRVSYKTEVNEEDFANAGNMPISFTITYVQADSTSHEREHGGFTVQELIQKANASNTTYDGVSDDQKKEMFAFDHTIPTVTTDYRYIGNQGADGPNNYITFNDEEWRIIGVFDGKIKIIRNLGIDSTQVVKPIGIRWDFKMSGLGSSEREYGSNDWSDAQLMYLLNRQYVDSLLKTGYTKSGDLIKDTNGNVIYRLGYRTAQQTNGLSTYNGTTVTTWVGLTDKAKNQVAEVTWYLGGITSSGSGSTLTYGTTEEMYQAERGITTCATIGNCTKARPTTWIGRIALMYPTDYAYTFGKGVNDPCYGMINKCRTDSYGIEGVNPMGSWLYITDKSQWTLSPRTANSSDMMYLDPSGGVTGNSANYSDGGVRPCVYLKSNIRLQGSGTTLDPYTIVNANY